MFNARLDFDVDGETQRDLRGRRGTDAARPRQPVAERVPRRSRRGSRPSRPRNAKSTRRASRTWRIVNPDGAQRARATDRRTSWCRRCRRRRCLRTPIRRSASAPRSRNTISGSRRTRPTNGVRRASTRTSIPATTACPRWTANDRSVADTDLVVWYSFGVTHFVRPEDWPVMPVEYTGLHVDAVRLLRPQPRARRSAHRRRALPLVTRVLVTNDDGIESAGLHVLAAALDAAGYDVTVVAPDRDRSGIGAAIGLVHADQHLDVEKVEMPGCARHPRVLDRRSARAVRVRRPARSVRTDRPTSWCRASIPVATRVARSCTRAPSAPRSPRRASAARRWPSASPSPIRGASTPRLASRWSWCRCCSTRRRAACST